MAARQARQAISGDLDDSARVVANGVDEGDAAYDAVVADADRVVEADGAVVDAEVDGAGAADDADAAFDRVSRLVEAFGPRRKVMLGLLDFCREPRAADEIVEWVNGAQADNVSVYGADVLCARLEESGGLRRLENAESSEPRVVVENGTEYLVPAKPASVCWGTTGAGVRVLESDDPLARLETALGDGGYDVIFARLLEMCDQDGGASAGDMSMAVDDDPLVQSPRLYAPHFFNILARCDCLGWTGAAWRTTELGRDALARLVS